jgi:GGDEF domain-containing protein
MRHAPTSGPLRNIRRQDYQKNGGGSWTRSWQVHFTFKGRKPVSQSFNDNRYGGKEAARLIAQRFRDAMENEFAASEIGFGKFGKVLTDREHGITRSQETRKSSAGVRYYPYWAADWPGLVKKKVNRKFYDSKHGGSDGAKEAAIAARQKGYSEYLEALRRDRVPRMKRPEGEDTRAPYTLFMPPEHLDIPVWRYMDFTKFVSMLENSGLFLPMVAKLDDPFEGSYSRGNQTLRPLVYRHMPDRFGLTAGEIVQRLRQFVAASCWHSNEQESAAMWKLYAKTHEAVCIQTTFRKLRDAMGSAARVGMVRYVDYETEWIPESNPLAPFLYKRKSFAHEREVRALIPPPDAEEILKGANPESKATGKWVRIDIAQTIERVFIAPDAPDWFLDLVKQVAARYERGNVPVVRSALAQTPFY